MSSTTIVSYEDDELNASGGNECYLADARPTMWVKRPKGAEVRC